MTNFWTIDTETTGLPFGFRQQEQPTSIVQLALRSSAGVTEDYWTEHSSKPLTDYFTGKLGQGEKASRALLQKLLSGEDLKGAAWQKGMLDPSNTLGTVFRQYMAVAHEAHTSGKSTFTRTLPGVGDVTSTFGATETQILDRVKGLLEKGDGIQGWNFNYDIQRLHETATKLGRTDVTQALEQAWSSGKARDLSKGWHDVLWHKAATPALAGGDPGLNLFHRSKDAASLTMDQLLAEREKTLQALAKGEAFTMGPDEKVLEHQPGFKKWFTKAHRQEVAAKLGISVADVDRRMATYSGFREVSFDYSHKVGTPSIVRTPGNQSFQAGRIRPELQYTALWSQDTISGALGLKERLASGKVSQKALQLQWGLHDASVDTLVTEQINRLSTAFEKSGMEGFQKELSGYGVQTGSTSPDGMSEKEFFNRLQHHARLHAIQKGMEKRLGGAGYDIAAAAPELASWLPAGAKTNTAQYAAAQISSTRKRTEPGLLQVLGAQGYNLAQKFQGKNRHAWYAGAAAIGLSAVAGMFNSGRATPETGEPRLSSALIEAMPSTIRGTYLHALTQAELIKRGLATRIEVPYGDPSVKGASGFIDAIGTNGIPIEIKSTQGVTSARPEHVRQLQRYIAATGSPYGTLMYVDPRGTTKSFSISGVRDPYSPDYMEYHGISPSALANVSDFGSGFNIHKAWYRAGRLSAAAPKPYRHQQDHIETSFYLSRHRTVDKTNRTVIPDAEARAVLGSTRAQRPPAFHLMDETLTHREGSLIREDRRLGWLRAAQVISKPPTDSPRFAGTLATASLKRPEPYYPTKTPMRFNTGMHHPVMPARIDTGIGSPPVPQMSKFQMKRGTWHSEAAVLDVVAMGARNGYQPPPLEVRGSRGASRFSGDAILTNPKPIWSNVTYSLPKGVQGPWNEGIHGFRPSQFQSKFPFGSQAHEQLNVAAFDMLAAQLMGLASVGLMGYMVLGGKGAVGMHMSDMALGRMGLAKGLDQDVFKHQIFKRMGAKFGFHPSKVRMLMKGAGFETANDLNDLQWKQFDESGYRSKKGFWNSIKAAWDESNAFVRALPSLRDGASLGTAMYNRGADSLRWLSGGSRDSLGRQLGFMARIRNVAINSIFSGGLAGHEEVATAIEDIVTQEKTISQGLSGRSALQLTAGTPTLFGSSRLGKMKNSWAGLLSRWGSDNIKEMSRLEKAHGAMVGKVAKFREAQFKAHLQKAGASTINRLTGARVAIGTLGAASFGLSWKARADRIGGMRGMGIGFFATLPEFMMMGLGSAAGSAFSGLGTIAGGFVGAQIGSVIGDAIESMGKSIFGGNLADPTMEYVRARNSMPFREYYQSHTIPGNPNMAWPGVGAEADEAYGLSALHPGNPNLSDFGSPYRVPSVLRQPVPKPPPVKKLRLHTPAGTVQKAWKQRSMSRIRDRASKTVV